MIQELAAPQDFILTTETVPGPSALLSGTPSSETLALAASITASYSDGEMDDQIPVLATRGLERITLDGRVMNKSVFKNFMLS